MIYCQGTIITPLGTVYTDPIINTYFLSYNEESGIFAFPQIVDSNLYPETISIVEQIEQILIPAPECNAMDREEITEIALMMLQNQFPNCKFFTYKL